MTSEILRFGSYYGEPILPPSEQKGSLAVEQFKEKYPFRYKLYDQIEAETEISNSVSPEAIVRHLQMLNNLDRYITAHGGPGKGRVLREKQLAVFKDTRDFLETGETEGFVEAPTGFGKTVLFSEVIKATNQRTLVVVPSKILVEQTYNKLSESNPTLNIGMYYSDKKERDKQVIVTTYHSLVISCGGVRPEDIDLLILDEVHQSLTDARIQAVGRFTNPVKLGFTATPEYTQDKRVENLLNNEIHTVTLKEAVETGLLCSFSVYLAETDVDLSSVKIDADGDYNERELENAVNIYSRNKSAIDLYKKLNEERKGLSKAVTYCVSIKHAREVARMFNEADIPAEAIWSDQDTNERRRIIDAYKKGEIKVLTNVNVLTEGFDDPQAALCLNLRPTLSKVVAKQRGGRVLRLDPKNPKKHAIVVDYLDKNENKRTLQVTFAQVAEGAQIINPVTIDTNGKDKEKEGEGNGDDEDKVSIDKEEPFDLEGLRVTTNSQEVLRIIREIEVLQDESNLEHIKDTDLNISSESCLRKLFIGNKTILHSIARRIRFRLEADHPECFARRKTKSSSIAIVVIEEGKQDFIEAMINEGVRLRENDMEEVQKYKDKVQKYKDKELRLVKKFLPKIFIGTEKKLLLIAEQVKIVLELEHPEYFAKKISDNGRLIDVVTNEGKDVFIREMIDRGVKLRDVATKDVESVKDLDLHLTTKILPMIFIGNGHKLLPIAQQVKERLELEHSNYFAKRRNLRNGRQVDVVTPEGKQAFIDAMMSVGVELKEQVGRDFQELKAGELSLSRVSLTEIFRGEIKKILPMVLRVKGRLESEHPEYFVKRKNWTNVVWVVTSEGRDIFIKAVVDEGVELKNK